MNQRSDAAASVATSPRDLGGKVVPERFDYSFGALPRPDGTVAFRVWAPNAATVHLDIEGAAPQAMHADGAGFYALTCPCRPGQRYWYRIDNEQAVPDPASRLQDDDVHGASVVVDAGGYVWKHDDWQGLPWTETVIYELHPGLAGGFSGIRERLAGLRDLGITAVELMPIADFPGPRNWGYDGVLPYAPDTAYGSPDELRHLIDTAHGMGMQVFLDVVYNHFGPDGNYLSAYAADFFRDDLHTPWGPAIDFRRPQVRAFFAENALYWLRDYRFDGLRLDAVHAISSKDWLPEMAAFVRGHIEPGRQVHLMLENDDNAASLMTAGFEAQWNDDGHHVLHHLLTGESQGYYAAYSDDPMAKLARCLADGFIYQGEPTVVRGGEPRGEPTAGLPPYAYIFFLQNHDQIGNRAFGERLISLCKAGPDALRAAVALQLLAPHIPMLFMGEETGSRAPFQYFTSFRQPELAHAVREGRRKEFAAFPEFADPASRSRIPDPNDVETWNHSVPWQDQPSDQAEDWQAWYRRVLQARRQFIVPRLPGAHSDSVCIIAPTAIVARWRMGDGAMLCLYCNLGEEDANVPAGMYAEREEVAAQSREGAALALREGRIPAYSTIATLERRHAAAGPVAQPGSAA
jgi:maltooligosyltrehalose trehalohydrolase